MSHQLLIGWLMGALVLMYSEACVGLFSACVLLNKRPYIWRDRVAVKLLRDESWPVTFYFVSFSSPHCKAFCRVVSHCGQIWSIRMITATSGVDSAFSSTGVTETHVAVEPKSPVSKEAPVLSHGYFCTKQLVLIPPCPSQTILLPLNGLFHF